MKLHRWAHVPAVVVVIVCVLVVGSAFLRAQESGQLLRWSTRDGRFFDGQFIRFQGNAVVVANGGMEFTVATSALSPRSLELARHLAARAALAGPVKPVARSAPAAPITPIPAVPAARAIPVRAAPAPAIAAIAPVASIDFGPSILAYCKERLGKTIGSGQCAALASAALRNVGAATRGGPDWPHEGDYVWGKRVASIKAGLFGLEGLQDLPRVEPGHIVQFHDTRFSGFNHWEDGLYQMEAQHHTAVVESVDPARKRITILHQNWNGHMVVHRETLFLRGMTKGSLFFYDPVPLPL